MKALSLVPWCLRLRNHTSNSGKAAWTWIGTTPISISDDGIVIIEGVPLDCPTTHRTPTTAWCLFTPGDLSFRANALVKLDYGTQHRKEDSLAGGIPHGPQVLPRPGGPRMIDRHQGSLDREVDSRPARRCSRHLNLQPADATESTAVSASLHREQKAEKTQKRELRRSLMAPYLKFGGCGRVLSSIPYRASMLLLLNSRKWRTKISSHR
jgi:hypothetical protein